MVCVICQMPLFCSCVSSFKIHLKRLARCHPQETRIGLILSVIIYVVFIWGCLGSFEEPVILPCSIVQHCLENSVDRGAWRTTVHGISESVTTERLKFQRIFIVDLKCIRVSRSVVSDSVTAWTVATGLLCPQNSSGKNTGVGCHSLLQETFPTQGSNPDHSHCRQILYCLSHHLW